MRTRIKAWGLALALALGLAVGIVQGAAARPLAADPLPPYKEPTSARFDISGSISSGDEQIQITGTGALSGKDLQEDVTVMAPGMTQTVTSSIIELGTKIYIKTSGTGSQEDNTWYVLDTNDLTGGQTTVPGMMGGSLTGPDPQYAAAFTSQQIGKETITGAATTEYQVDVDLQKLLTLMGTPPDPQTAATLQNTTLRMYLWIGDADTYLHRLSLMAQSKIPVSDTESTGVALALTITYRDIDTQITIVAPPDAVPLPVAGPGGAGSLFPGGLPTGMPGLLPGMPGTLPGMPGVLPGMPVTQPAPTGTGAVPGMPRTGNPLPINAWPVLLFSLGCLLTGGWLRRRTAPGPLTSLGRNRGARNCTPCASLHAC